MLPSGYKVPHLLTFAYLTDRSGLGPVPLRLLRWLSLIFVFLGSWRGVEQDWTQAAVLAGTGLILTLLTLGLAAFTFKFQKETEVKLYRAFDHKLGLDSLPYDAAKIRGVLRRSLKASWRGRALERLMLKGEGGKIDERDLRELLAWVDGSTGKASGLAHMIADEEELAFGKVTLVRVTTESPAYEEFHDAMKIRSLMDGVLHLSARHGLMSVEFEGRDPFTAVEVAGYNDKDVRGIQSYNDALQELMGKSFPPAPGFEWRLHALSSSSLRIAQEEPSPEEIHGATHVRELQSLFDGAKKRYDPATSSPDRRAYRLGMALVSFDELVYRGETLVGFRMVFRSPGNLHDRAVFSKFFRLYCALLGKQYGGQWESGQDLLANEVYVSRSGELAD